MKKLISDLEYLIRFDLNAESAEESVIFRLHSLVQIGDEILVNQRINVLAQLIQDKPKREISHQI